jgi:hypothetical protein
VTKRASFCHPCAHVSLKKEMAIIRGQDAHFWPPSPLLNLRVIFTFLHKGSSVVSVCHLLGHIKAERNAVWDTQLYESVTISEIVVQKEDLKMSRVRRAQHKKYSNLNY